MLEADEGTADMPLHTVDDAFDLAGEGARGERLEPTEDTEDG